MKQRVLLVPPGFDGQTPPGIEKAIEVEGRERPKVGTIETVDRDAISAESRDRFQEARSNGDTQEQLDVLYEILTGETPGGN